MDLTLLSLSIKVFEFELCLCLSLSVCLSVCLCPSLSLSRSLSLKGYLGVCYNPRIRPYCKAGEVATIAAIACILLINNQVCETHFALEQPWVKSAFYA